MSNREGTVGSDVVGTVSGGREWLSICGVLGDDGRLGVVSEQALHFGQPSADAVVAIQREAHGDRLVTCVVVEVAASWRAAQ